MIVVVVVVVVVEVVVAVVVVVVVVVVAVVVVEVVVVVAVVVVIVVAPHTLVGGLVFSCILEPVCTIGAGFWGGSEVGWGDNNVHVIAFGAHAQNTGTTALLLLHSSLHVRDVEGGMMTSTNKYVFL